MKKLLFKLSMKKRDKSSSKFEYLIHKISLKMHDGNYV
jgi:hypothetical protein